MHSLRWLSLVHCSMSAIHCMEAGTDTDKPCQQYHPKAVNACCLLSSLGWGSQDWVLMKHRRQIEDAHAMAVDDLRRDHSAELQRQAEAHAALCQELHARAEATAAAIAKMSSDAAASQQVGSTMNAGLSA